MQLPLLNALKTFIVSAQRLNFTKASEDLLVSPSAISHQIKILEEYLGYKLFFRKNRTLVLTSEGEQLFSKLEKPFQEINHAVVESRTPRGKMRINLGLRPFLSSMWLTSQLEKFWKSHPLIEIHLIHNLLPPDFQREHINLAIVWGKDDWPDCETVKLVPGNLTPICSAQYLEQYGPFDSADQFRNMTLIHDESNIAWSEWLQKKFNTSSTGHNNIYIDDTNVRLQSIRNHQGIMLGCPFLLKSFLDAKELVQLSDVVLEDYAYYLVYPKSLQLSEREIEFVTWLKSIAVQPAIDIDTVV